MIDLQKADNITTFNEACCKFCNSVHLIAEAVSQPLLQSTTHCSNITCFCKNTYPEKLLHASLKIKFNT